MSFLNEKVDNFNTFCDKMDSFSGFCLENGSIFRFLWDLNDFFVNFHKYSDSSLFVFEKYL